MNYKVAPHFTIAELVSKQVLDLWAERATWFIDPRILVYLEYLRVRFGPVYVNNWYWGGNKDSRGFRSHLDTEGGSMSQHRYGRAVDCTFKDATADEVREDIRLNWSLVYRPIGITCIEEDVSWVHADMRYIKNQTDLMIVRP